MEVPNATYAENLYSQPSTSATAHILFGNFPDEGEINVDIESSQEYELSTSIDNEIETPVVCAENEFFFETDHPALKENEDYRKLLNVVISLEAKRVKAIEDLDRLYECRSDALRDPMGYLKKLHRGDDMNIPTPIEIPDIPTIDWDKYALTGSNSALTKHQLTRQLSKVAEVFEDHNKMHPDASKSPKFIQPWTPEEQKKLEQLLLKYPPEEIESRRWEKIANRLENRTPIQVASRVQKYFIKLMRAGMPIPGRQPNMSYLRKPRRVVIRQQPSTFLVSHTPSVHINYLDEDKDLDYVTVQQSDSDDDFTSENRTEMSDEEICEELKDSEEYKDLLRIKKVLKQKQTSGLAQHVRFKCARCECEPIIGVRWQCRECQPVGSINFCEDCVDCMHETQNHVADHKMEPIAHALMFYGRDNRVHFPGTDYNYLDPNYMPAM